MVKNWADHFSSDEEDVNEEEEEEEERAVAPPPAAAPAAPAAAKKQQPRTYDFPSGAVDQPEHLADEITGLTQQFLGLQVNVMDARIATDHHHPSWWWQRPKSRR